MQAAPIWANGRAWQRSVQERHMAEAYAYPEPTQLQHFNATSKGCNALLESSVAQANTPELVLLGIPVYICQVLLHGVEASCDSCAVV